MVVVVLLLLLLRCCHLSTCPLPVALTLQDQRDPCNEPICGDTCLGEQCCGQQAVAEPLGAVVATLADQHITHQHAHRHAGSA